MRIAFLLLALFFTGPASAQDGWFVPNPQKWRSPYYGTNQEAHQVKKLVETMIPNMKVLIDRHTGAVLFEGRPLQMKTLRYLAEKLGLKSSESKR